MAWLGSSCGYPPNGSTAVPSLQSCLLLSTPISKAGIHSFYLREFQLVTPGEVYSSPLTICFAPCQELEMPAEWNSEFFKNGALTCSSVIELKTPRFPAPFQL